MTTEKNQQTKEHLTHLKRVQKWGQEPAFPDQDLEYGLTKLEYHTSNILQGLVTGLAATTKDDLMENRTQRADLVQLAVFLAAELVRQTSS